MEIITAAREGLPVKFFVLDDQAYHYMQMLQKPAYLRTTATILARMDYTALRRAFGVAYTEVFSHADLDAKVRGAVCHNGPVLVRVATDYGNRKIAGSRRCGTLHEGTHPSQKARFLRGSARGRFAERRRAIRRQSCKEAHKAQKDEMQSSRLFVPCVLLSGQLVLQPKSNSTFQGGVFSNSQPIS